MERKVERLCSKNSEVLEAVVLVDRTIDLVSPVDIQHTYHGLLDEVLGASTCRIGFNAGLYH